jgi:hypothetical protein
MVSAKFLLRFLFACVLTIGALHLFASVAGAQTPVTNPTLVVFTPAIDHALVSEYEFGYFTTAADADPIRKTTLLPADLTPMGPDLSFPFPKLAFGSFTHKLRACAAALCSPWVQADRPSELRPLAPNVPQLRVLP